MPDKDERIVGTMMDERVRIEALRIAASGLPLDAPADIVVNRAQVFEAYIRGEAASESQTEQPPACSCGHLWGMHSRVGCRARREGGVFMACPCPKKAEGGIPKQPDGRTACDECGRGRGHLMMCSNRASDRIACVGMDGQLPCAYESGHQGRCHG